VRDRLVAHSAVRYLDGGGGRKRTLQRRLVAVDGRCNRHGCISLRRALMKAALFLDGDKDKEELAVLDGLRAALYLVEGGESERRKGVVDFNFTTSKSGRIAMSISVRPGVKR